MDLKIYYGIFKDNMIKKYNLKEDSLYHIIDLTKHGENDINDLNPYYAELCTMYYVWKNNLKSDYVGFCHYRTYFCDFAFDKLKHGYVQTAMTRFFKNDKEDSLYKYCKELNINEYLLFSYNRYLIEQHNININLCKDPVVAPSYCNMFICSYEQFDDIMQFIFGFLDYLFPNESWKDIDNVENFRNLLRSYAKRDLQLSIKLKDNRWCLNKRMFTYFFENLLGVYISNKFKYIDYQPDNNISVYIKYDNDKDFNEKLFTKWHHKQIGSGITKIYFLYNDKLNIENTWEFNYINKYTTLLNKDNHHKLPKNAIKLNIDEYIDVVNPYHFYKTGIYDIKKI